jgi:transcription elongation factor Elf1
MAESRASHQASPQYPEGCISTDSYDAAKQDINGICECVGCNANATSRVSVKVGDKGQITLFLCEKCKQRFSDSEFISHL